MIDRITKWVEKTEPVYTRFGAMPFAEWAKLIAAQRGGTVRPRGDGRLAVFAEVRDGLFQSK